MVVWGRPATILIADDSAEQMDDVDLRALEQGGYLHDLGKVTIPDAILFKPGPLTTAEFDLVKSHPIVGDRICAPLRTLDGARSIIRSHHEALDGSGYPDRLRGANVPLLAQVTGLVDVYDALVTDRPYRRAVSIEAAMDVLRADARRGRRDATLVEEFLAVLESEVRDRERSGGRRRSPSSPPTSSPRSARWSRWCCQRGPRQASRAGRGRIAMATRSPARSSRSSASSSSPWVSRSEPAS